jgi:hypothetical protein
MATALLIPVFAIIWLALSPEDRDQPSTSSTSESVAEVSVLPADTITLYGYSGQPGMRVRPIWASRDEPLVTVQVLQPVYELQELPGYTIEIGNGARYPENPLHPTPQQNRGGLGMSLIDTHYTPPPINL